MEGNKKGSIIMVPSLFIGHGSPYLAVTQNEYSDFLKELGKRIKPKAIVIFSAHWETQTLALTYTDDILDTVYDYYGFPEDMYKIKYPAKGSKIVAEILENRFKKAGIETKREEEILLAKSEEFTALIEERLVTAYQRIRNGVRNKLAVVSIERGASAGSYFTIPPQVQVEIAARKKIITDEHSGRILVDAALAEEEREKINAIIASL